MGLQISGLGKPLVAIVKWTDVRSITGVDTDVCAEVEVQGEPLTTTFEGTLQKEKAHDIIWLLSTKVCTLCNQNSP